MLLLYRISPRNNTANIQNILIQKSDYKKKDVFPSVSPFTYLLVNYELTRQNTSSDTIIGETYIPGPGRIFIILPYYAPKEVFETSSINSYPLIVLPSYTTLDLASNQLSV